MGRSSRGSRSPSRTSCASPSSSTTSASHYIEAGWPGANPKDDELFRRAPDGAEARRRARSSPSDRRGGSRARSTATTRCATSSRRTSAPCASSASRGTTTSSKRSARPSTRASRWSRDSVEFLRGAGLDVLFDAEHFFDGYAHNPEFALRVLEGAATGRRVPARAVRHERRCAAARRRARRARGRRVLRRATSASPSTCTTTAAPVSRTRSPACAVARCRCRARSTATANAPATATSRRSSRTSR